MSWAWVTLMADSWCRCDSRSLARERLRMCHRNVNAATAFPTRFSLMSRCQIAARDSRANEDGCSALLRLEVERHFNASRHGLAIAVRRGEAPATHGIGGGTIKIA